MPRHKKRVFFNPETKQVISTTQNQINSDLYTEINVPIRHAEIKSIFDHPHCTKIWKDRLNPYTEIKSSSFPDCESKSIWTTHRNQVNFYASGKTKWFWPATKTSQFRAPTHKPKINYSPHKQDKSFSTTTQRPSQFRSLHRNQIKYDHWHNIINLTPTM